MAEYFYMLLSIIILYKVLDRLLRIPKLFTKPTGKFKNILVTGCDTGFGNVFAKRMASKGFTVFAGCLTQTATADLSKVNPKCLKPFEMDVTREESVKKGYEYVTSQLNEHEGLWAIVNNAGVMGTNAPLEWLKKSHFDQVMSVNVYGILQVTNQFLPLVKKTKGRIINTCSVLGRIALPLSGPYVSSKFAAEALSDTLRVEMLPFGVSVHIIEPGLVTTNLVAPQNIAASSQKCWDSLAPEMKEEYGEKYLRGIAKLATKFMPRTGTSNLNVVIDCYEHAVDARFPRTRYMPGLDSKYFYWWLSYMPEWFSDSVLSIVNIVALPAPKGAKKYAHASKL